MLRAHRRLPVTPPSLLRGLAVLAFVAGLGFAGTARADIPPVANDDYGFCTTNQYTEIDLLMNDYGMEIYILVPQSILLHLLPDNGSVDIDYDTGVATYTPDTDFTGYDDFEYSVCDLYGNRSNIAWVGVDIASGGGGGWYPPYYP